MKNFKKTFALVIGIAVFSIFTVDAQNWSITGNAGTNTTDNFIGTTDNVGLSFRTKNKNRMRISSGGWVGIGTSSATSSSIFEVVSTSSGILIPRMTKLQRDAITSPATSLLIYQTDNTPGYYHYTGTEWTGDWQVGGNAFTTGTSKNFGISDCRSLRIITNGIDQMEFTPACISPAGKSTLKVYNTDSILFEVATADFTNKLRVGGGEIGDEGGTMSMARASASSLVADTVNGFLMKSFPNFSKSVLLVSAVSPTAVNCTALTASSDKFPGFGTGIKAEGGRTALFALAKGGTSTSSTVIGVNGVASATGKVGTRIGVRGEADSALFGYGIFGIAINCDTSRAGFFSGNVEYTGSLLSTSDMKLKENIKPYTGALDKLKMVEVKSYNFKPEYSFMHLPEGNQVGVISQQLETVFPQLVLGSVHPADYDAVTGERRNEEVHYKGVNYTGLIPIMIAGINEQQQQIGNLKNENAELRNELAEIRNALSKLGLSDIKNVESKTASLQQNVPNPFNEKTDIKYFVPVGTVNAVINIYSETHSLLKSYPVMTQGSGQITIEAGTLATGNYLYELVINGSVAASKKMNIIR